MKTLTNWAIPVPMPALWEAIMATKILLILLSIFFWHAVPAPALTERDMEFMRRHLDVQPAPDWIKVESPGRSETADCVGYRNKESGVALLACPIAGKKDFAEVLADEKKAVTWVMADKCVISQEYDGRSVTIVAPLKKGSGGAFFLLSLNEPVEENFYKCLVEIQKNGQTITALDAKLLQKAEPMLRVFRDFAMPATLPVFHSVPIVDKDTLAEIATRK